MARRKQSQSQLDNLQKAYDGKGGFCTESARRAAVIKHEKEKVYRPLREIVLECLDEDNVREIMAALLQRAKEGDVRAWESLRDSSGQKPKEEVLVGAEKELDISIKVVD